MIKIKNLNKKIGKKQILKDINLEINEGDRIALIGGNGAGKTTLIETILGIQSPDSGTISYTFEYSHSPLEQIGVQFQDANYPYGLTVRRIIDFFKEKAISPDIELIDRFIKELEMDKFIDTDGSQISGGEAQKLNILLALINKPKIIFLDELTTGLDIVSRNIILEFIERYIKERANSTMVIITHMPNEIKKFCNKIVLMKNGRIEWVYSLKDLKNNNTSIDEVMDSIK